LIDFTPQGTVISLSPLMPELLISAKGLVPLIFLYILGPGSIMAFLG